MKPLLVYYINVDGMLPGTIDEYTQSISESLKMDDYQNIIIPVRNQPTKIECINPIFVPIDFYEKYKLNLKMKLICKLKKIGELHGRA